MPRIAKHRTFPLSLWVVTDGESIKAVRLRRSEATSFADSYNRLTRPGDLPVTIARGLGAVRVNLFDRGTTRSA